MMRPPRSILAMPTAARSNTARNRPSLSLSAVRPRASSTIVAAKLAIASIKSRWRVLTSLSERQPSMRAPTVAREAYIGVAASATAPSAAAIGKASG